VGEPLYRSRNLGRFQNGPPLGTKKDQLDRKGASTEVLNLDEGPVTLTVPATLSEASYADLADQFELFLRRAKRRVTNKKKKRPPTERHQRRSPVGAKRRGFRDVVLIAIARP
jgi:hypothetical protein